MAAKETGNRHRGFWIAVSLWVLVLALVYGGYVWFGREWMVSSLMGEKAKWADRPTAILELHADRRFDPLFGIVSLVSTGAFLAFYLFRIRPGFVASAAGLLVYYIGVELAIAPFLIGSLSFQHYQIVKDPDHHPLQRNKRHGWNSDGLRQKWEPEEFTGRTQNLLFLGDSFTFGYRVKPEEAFPALVEARFQQQFPDRDWRVANFGWTSASPILALRRLQEIGEQYQPDHVVLCLDMTDPHDDIKYGNLIERRGITALYDVLPLTIGFLRLFSEDLFWKLYIWSTDGNLPRERFFHSAQPLALSEPFLEPMAQNIDQIAKWCRDHGAEFLVFVLPRYYQYNDQESPHDWETVAFGEQSLRLGPHCQEPFAYFDELQQSRPYSVVPLLEAFESTDVFPTCFDDDPHWNADGHRVAAEAIFEVLSEELSLE